MINLGRKNLAYTSALLLFLLSSIAWSKEPIVPAEIQALETDAPAKAAQLQDSVDTSVSPVDEPFTFVKLPEVPPETAFEPTSIAANLDEVVAPEPPPTEDFTFTVAQAEQVAATENTVAEQVVTYEMLPAQPLEDEFQPTSIAANLDEVIAPEPPVSENFEFKVAQIADGNTESLKSEIAAEAPTTKVESLQQQDTKPASVEQVAAAPETVAPAPAKAVENPAPSVSEKAYQVLKETLKEEADEKAKIKDQKAMMKDEQIAKSKPFPKNEVLTIELENPNKYNGLPKTAIEKVPGLAKDKTATFMTLKDAVQTSVVTNPEVLQSYKNFEGAVKEADAAWGRYLPSVDLIASYGQENRNDPLVGRDNGRLGGAYVRSQASLSVRQMLFDGFFTKTEVERLSRTSRARLFEMEEQSNAVALETVKAYTDLLRFRKLTELSEDNYVAHKVIYEQLLIKAKAGVGKKSDVEQAKSRLSLAEYNMTVEGANLHDIEARFQKVVGFLPPDELDSAMPVNRDIPSEAKQAIIKAQYNSPKLLATIEDSLSQQALLDNKDSAFMPKLDLRMRADRGNDLNGYDGYHGNDVAEVVMSWNLFNGNSDVNFKKKERALLEAAINRRDKFCRDIRVELEIAYNDIKKLIEQYNYLDTRAIAIEKARDAYRKQFEIGQRTLIDLLNTENELYEAKRLLTNIQNDLNFAYARTHYQMGSLLPVLDVTRYASSTTAPRPSSLSELGSNIAVCPAEAPTPYKANKKNLDSRANEFISAPKEGAPAQSENLNKDFREMVAPQ